MGSLNNTKLQGRRHVIVLLLLHLLLGMALAGTRHLEEFEQANSKEVTHICAADSSVGFDNPGSCEYEHDVMLDGRILWL